MRWHCSRIAVPWCAIVAGFVCVVTLSVGTQKACADTPQPPRIVDDAPKNRPVRLPDGSLMVFVGGGARQEVSSITSRDGGLTWSERKDEFALPHARMSAVLPLLDVEGRLHLVLTRAHGEGRPAAGLSIDLWHVRSSADRMSWEEPHAMWLGYCGAVMDVKQLRSGRLIVPFAAWNQPGDDVVRDTGLNYTTAVTSDDAGATWQLAPSRLTSPCTPGFNGNNYGAIEPTILPLADARTWMLMRTQTEFLYESFSLDGATWTPAVPSRFRSSSSPAALERLADKRIVLFWNHCQTPPRVDGQGVYGGRDALHAAVSADEGKTWSGFREVYRDPYRNDTPPRRGDRGTAYPVATAVGGSTVALATGQGNRRRLLLVDADWITAKRQTEDFAGGLEAWHVWKPFGPASGYWRDRTIGARLVDSPSGDGAKVLALGKHDEHAADCASWNFPAGQRGRLTLRLWLPADFAGATLSLDDRYFNPDDDRGESEAVFSLSLDADGSIAEKVPLRKEQWTTVTIAWDTTEGGTSHFATDDAELATIPQQHATWCGPNYLRLRSHATEIERGGLLVAAAEVEVE